MAEETKFFKARVRFDISYITEVEVNATSQEAAETKALEAAEDMEWDHFWDNMVVTETQVTCIEEIKENTDGDINEQDEPASADRIGDHEGPVHQG